MPTNPQLIDIRNPAFALQAVTPPPVIADADPGELLFDGGTTSDGSLAGTAGSILRQTARGDGLTVEREIFTARDHSLWGIRLTLSNHGSQSMRLTTLTPLRAAGAAAIELAHATFADWRVLRMSRHKNDIPGVFRPTQRDADYLDAQFSSSDVVAGQGVSRSDVQQTAAENRTVSSEPCILIRGADDRPGLFIGFLGQTEHLSDLALTSGVDNRLGNLEATCEFDRVPIAPGESRATHWLLIAPYDDEPAMLERFADWLADLHQVSRPGPAPSLYCSWYFYGREMTEHDLHENLEALRQRPIPFDILMIDDCWSDYFGSWNANEKWPSGMADAARRIREAGFEPGIWTCPFVVMADSPVLRIWPDIIARNAAGEFCRFGYQGPACYVVDVTAPDSVAYFNEFYGRLRAWGFRHHKFDFLRAIVADPDIRFHDATLTRAQAYRLGLQRVRQALGEDAYILACGGLFEGSIGLADGMRSGTDTKGSWRFEGYTAGRHSTLITTKQNIFRAYTNRFWHTDPDAAMIRLRDQPFHPKVPTFSLGDYSDEEAFAVMINQYIGGGIACLSERFAEFQDSRRALWRHTLPVGVPHARMLDPHRPDCPSLLLTAVTPADPALPPWWTLAVFNLSPEPLTRRVSLSALRLPPSPGGWAVFEFREQRFLGVRTADETVALDIPARGARLLRLAPWNGTDPVILGTDLHFSSGGVELAGVRIEADAIHGRLETRWNYPATISAGFPTADGPRMVRCQVAPGHCFRLGL